MPLRHKINIATIIIIALILFLTRHELAVAWKLLETVNVWMFLLVIPIQFISYYAAGAMSFSYLRGKGNLKDTSSMEAAKMALELNFVNHILPSGGVSGASYMTWRLSQLGVSSGRATLSQVVRIVSTFVSFAALLVVAVLFITFDDRLNRITILVSSALLSVIIISILLFAYLIGSKHRMHVFSRWLHKVINIFWHKVLRQKSRELISTVAITRFFDDLQEDYHSLRTEPGQLKKSLVWGFVFNIAETAMFFVAFLSMGAVVNPAPIFIAIGLAGLAATFLVTPGGAGGYEAAMVLFLAGSGINGGLALAGVILARVTLILVTIISGYFFYHQALQKFGKVPGGPDI